MVDFVGTQIFSGQAQGLAEGYRNNFTPEAQAGRAAAYAKKAEMEQKLRQIKATAPTDADLKTQSTIQSQELEKLKQENDLMLGKLTRASVFDSFDRYTGDGDTRHLNTMFSEMRTNKFGKSLFGGMVRADKLSAEDTTLMQQAGLDPELVLENPEIGSRLVKITKQDGSQQITDMHTVFKVTGYTNFAQGRELEIAKKRADIMKAYNDTSGTAKTASERLAYDKVISQGLKPGTPEFEAAYVAERSRMGIGKPKSPGGSPSDDPGSSFKSQQEREAYRLVKAEGLDPLSSQGSARFTEIYSEIIKRDKTPSAIRTADNVDETTLAVEAKAKAMGTDFFDIDFSDNSMRRKFEPEIQRIEKLGGFELTADQRKELGFVKSLMKLGPPTANLTAEEVGLVNNLLFNVKKYYSNSVKGVEATSSYATFRNTIRHALYGSTLTEGEIASFEQQFGNLKQQRGPILEQLKTATGQIQAKLESINSLGNSYVTHFRLGTDQKALNIMLDNLDKLTDRLNMLEMNSTEVSDDTELNTKELKPEDIQKLDSIFGGAQ